MGTPPAPKGTAAEPSGRFSAGVRGGSDKWPDLKLHVARPRLLYTRNVFGVYDGGGGEIRTGTNVFVRLLVHTRRNVFAVVDLKR